MTLVANPLDETQAIMGVSIQPAVIELKPETREKYGSLPWIFPWLSELFFWLYAISLGVGLFNLLPLGPVDGGQMFMVAASKFFSKEKAQRIFVSVSLLVVLLIFINLLPFLIDLLSFLFSPVLFLLF